LTCTSALPVCVGLLRDGRERHLSDNTSAVPGTTGPRIFRIWLITTGPKIRNTRGDDGNRNPRPTPARARRRICRV